ncbi:MAG: DUF3515 domain-containing protein [Actinobacteria bacterium HGW-Actinobacteria-4]|nr:MAG: DUF3515 domain-containing protein [Actinobacteria bacterium HGW-Actinobacteria-4]
MRWTSPWIAVTVAIATLGGCAQPYVVEAAPYAGDPACAPVMLAVPDVVGGLEYRVTTSQATAAWGDEFVMVARCGVEPPGPTTDPCLAVSTGSITMDWIIREDDDFWYTTTFGRSPALELTIPKALVDEALPEILTTFSYAAALAPTNGLQCR